MAKLLRKDVLKWIRALSSGQYRKGKEKLVSNDGTKFCCLGVWADMQGATWQEIGSGCELVPTISKRGKIAAQQGSSYLYDTKLSKGLTIEMQTRLAEKNDVTKGFRSVIAMIKKEVLPLAK